MKIIIKSSLFIVLLYTNVYSQSLSIGLSTGYFSIQGENYYSHDLGNIGAYYINGTRSSFGGLNFGSNFNFSLKAKYTLEVIPFNFVAGLSYIPARGNQSVEIFDSFINRFVINDITTKIDIWSFSIGTRYTADLKIFKPYLTAALLINYFGDTRLQFDYNEVSTSRPDYENGMRYGFNYGIGVGRSIFNNIDLEIEVCYNYLNLWNRRESGDPEDDIITSEERLNTISVSMNFYYMIL